MVQAGLTSCEQQMDLCWINDTSALARVNAEQPVVLLDATVLDKPVDVLRQVKSQLPGAAVFLLTSHVEYDCWKEAVSAGAQDVFLMQECWRLASWAAHEGKANGSSPRLQAKENKWDLDGHRLKLALKAGRCQGRW